MYSVCMRLLREEEAATAVEYAVMLALILGTILAAVGTFGSQTGGMWGSVNTKLNGVGFGS